MNAQSAVNAQNALKAQNAEKVPWTGIQDRPDVALKSDIPTKTSELGNDSGYVTEDQLAEYVKFDDLPDLSGYAGEGYVDEKVAQEALARQKADEALSDRIDEKAPISAIPTKTSELDNDSGYLTEHQSLSDYYTKAQTDEKIAEKETAYELLSRNDLQKIEGDGLVYRLSAGEWVQTGELALKTDISANQDSVTKEYVDEKVTQEALARQEADQELRAALGAKANLDQVPTKTSQLNNDSGFIGTEQLQDYYTKTQTDEAISNAVSAKEDAKYIESEDGKKRIYGNGDVKSLSSAPGEYGPWTAEDGTVDETWHVIEISSGVFGWTNDSYDNSIETWSSEEEALKAVKFTVFGGIVWTRSFVPGPSGWKKDGELELKERVDANFFPLSGDRTISGKVVIGAPGAYNYDATLELNGAFNGTASLKTIGRGELLLGHGTMGGGMISCTGSKNIGGILIQASGQEIGLMHSQILVDGKRVVDEASLSAGLSAYVSKTEIVPSQMIPGAAEAAYQAMKAQLDGQGNEITATYASKTDLTAKQDVLPVNLQTGIYDISAWGAAQAAYVPWSGVEDKQIASATEPGIVKVGANLTIDADGTLNAEGGGSSSNGYNISVEYDYQYGGGSSTTKCKIAGFLVGGYNSVGTGMTVDGLTAGTEPIVFPNQVIMTTTVNNESFNGDVFVNGARVTATAIGPKVWRLSGDTVVKIVEYWCLAAGTRITLADGSWKNIEDIGYDDQLLVWNFDEGRPDSAKPFWIKKKQTAPYFWDIRFDDGTSVRACGPKGHEFFSVDRQDFVYGDMLAGHTVLNSDGGTARCVSSTLVEGEVDMYNLLTEKHVDCFANGVLAGCSLCKNLYGIEGLRFVKKPKKLRGYDEFEGEVPLWWFNAARYAESSSPRETLVKYYKDRIGLMK